VNALALWSIENAREEKKMLKKWIITQDHKRENNPKFKNKTKFSIGLALSLYKSSTTTDKNDCSFVL
jgi:hypothetical protein